MAFFEEVMQLSPNTRVLDVGGNTINWQYVKTPLDITVLNLPGTDVDVTTHGEHRFTFIFGDATAMPEHGDKSFDIVFSNSVIEHVGDKAKRKAFASEVRRVGTRYYTQTPSKYFPLEAHTGIPFWWFFPTALKQHFFRKWEHKLPLWNQMIQGTTVVSKREMSELFPGSSIKVDRLVGFPKSYTVYRSSVS
jgi:SAM-dependent methyltransferase